MSSHVFKIENGVLALSVVAPGDPSDWQTPTGEGVDEVTLADYTTATGMDFSCQVTSGALTASPNTTTDTTPATFCGPEVTTTAVGVTSYSLDATILQDPDVAAGVSAFLFEHDTKEAYFLLGLDGVNPPKAVGRVRVVAGAIGGDARVTLTATLSLPVSRKPDIEFGDATSSRIVLGGAGTPATGASAGTPGSWTPGGSTPPASPADLTAGVPNVVVATPATSWTTGQYVQTATAGTGGRAYWNGTAWTAGAAP